MADSTDELFRQLDAKHPDWLEWEDEWKRYRDVLGDILVEESTYLPRNSFEPQGQYEFRLDMSQFIPESGLPIDRLMGALYQEKPKRSLGGNDQDLKEFLDRSTKKGLDWNATVEAIVFNLLGYGTTRVLVNVPPAQIEDEKGLSRKEEKDLNVRPWVTNYTPLSVTDWEYDEDGMLLFVRIKEARTVKDPDNKLKPHQKEIRFIEYDRNEVRWWVFVETDTGGNRLRLVEQEVRMHGLGVVPMVVEAVREIKDAVGNSFIRYSSKADVRKFQAESDYGYGTYMHAHPFLAVWTEDELKEVGIGTSSFLKLNPGTEGVGREDARYVEAPKSAFEALQDVINENRTQIFRQAQVDPMGIVASGNQAGGSVFQASGVSRAWSFGTSEARILKKIADRMSVIEKRVFEIVLRWQASERQVSPTEDLFKGDIQYPEEFDLASTNQLLEERGQIAAMVNSPTLIRQLDLRIAASKVGDTTAEVLKEIQDEIEENPLLGTMAGRTNDPFAMPEIGGIEVPSGGESAENDQPREGDEGNNGRSGEKTGRLGRNSRAGGGRGGRARAGARR